MTSLLTDGLQQVFEIQWILTSNKWLIIERLIVEGQKMNNMLSC